MTYLPENVLERFFPKESKKSLNHDLYAWKYMGVIFFDKNDKNEKKSKKSLNLDFFDPKILAPKVWSKKSWFYDFFPKWA